MDKVLRVLIFFRLVDGFDGNLSITNLGMFVSLYRLITVPQASYSDVGATLIAFGNYGFKKYLNNNTTTQPVKDANVSS